MISEILQKLSIVCSLIKSANELVAMCRRAKNWRTGHALQSLACLSAHSCHEVGWEAPIEIFWQMAVPTKTTVTFNKNSCHRCQSKFVKIVHFQATRTKTFGGLKSLFKKLSIARRNVSLIYLNASSCKWQSHS